MHIPTTAEQKSEQPQLADFKKVLLVEDNPADVELIRRAFSDVQNDFQLDEVSRVRSAYEKLVRDKYDLVLLDLNLPDSHGLSALLAIRKQSPTIPVVVLTENDNEQTAVQALREGAQDYILKNELVGKRFLRCIHFALERHNLSLGQTTTTTVRPISRLTVNKLVLDLETAKAFEIVNENEIEIGLTPLEFKILVCLAKQPRVFFSRQALLEKIHHGRKEEIDDRSIDRHVNAMRRKAEILRRYIRSVYKVGYQLNPDFKDESGEDSSASARSAF